MRLVKQVLYWPKLFSGVIRLPYPIEGDEDDNFGPLDHGYGFGDGCPLGYGDGLGAGWGYGMGFGYGVGMGDGDEHGGGPYAAPMAASV